MSEDEKNLPPPSVENGATQQPPPAVAEAPDPVEQVKEKLAEQMKAGTFDGEAAPPETPKPDAKTTPAPTPEAKVSDASKATEPPAADEDPDAVYDDPEDATPDEVDPKFTKIRERIQKTRSTLRETRKQLAEHNRRLETAKLAGFDEKTYEEWVLLGARANMGDPAAIHELGRRLKATGFKFEEPAPAKPAPPADDEAAAKALYNKHFKARVDAYQMDEGAALEAAKQLAAELRERAPVLSQPQTQVPPQQFQAPAPQQYQPQVDPIKQRVLSHMESLNQQYAKALPNWQEVNAEAEKLVQADLKAGKQLDPLMWASDWQLKVRQAQILVNRRKATTSQPAVRVADTSLRPGRGAPPATAPKAGDKQSTMNAVAAALAAGNLDDLP